MTPNFFRLSPNISGLDKATNVKFGRFIHRDSLSKEPDYLFPKTGVAISRHYQHFRVSPNISGMGKATNVELNISGKCKATNVELVNKTGNIKYA